MIMLPSLTLQAMRPSRLVQHHTGCKLLVHRAATIVKDQGCEPDY
jgi:hypothetical protein